MSSTQISEVTVPLLYREAEAESVIDRGRSIALDDDDKMKKVERPTALSVATDVRSPKITASVHRRNRSADYERRKETILSKYSEWSPHKFNEDVFNASGNSKNVLPSSQLVNSKMRVSRSPNRKLSESRGVKLPDITIKPLSEQLSSKSKSLFSERINGKQSKRKQVSYFDQQEASISMEQSNSASPNSPPLTSSPVGYTLRHREFMAADTSAKMRSQSTASQQAPLNDAIDITVFFADQRGFKFSLIGGKMSTASNLICLMAQHLDIDATLLQETCALWMVSDLLEVQLKSHHIPYEVHKSWNVLLKRFAHAELEEIIADEPLIFLKRNVQLSVEQEIELENGYERLTEIFYVTAKEEVLTGRYLCDLETSIHLAALQMAIELGPYDPLEHSVDSLSDEILRFFPVQHRHSVKTVYLFGFPVIGCRGVENDILEEYQTVSTQYGSNHERRKAYLEILRDTPFYGAAFFRGQVERPPAGSLKDFKKMLLAAAMPEIEVFVGINREYVTVIDPAKHELLLVQPLFDCSWRRVDVEPSNGQSQNRSLSSETENLPCFLLHFPDDSESVDRKASVDNEQVEAPEKSKLLQVFSRQAVMMEALMTALYTIGIFEAKEFTDVEDELVDLEDIDAEGVDSRDNGEFEGMEEVRDTESPTSTSTAEVEGMPQHIRSNGGRPKLNGEQKTLREHQARSSTTGFRSGSPQKQDRNGGHPGKICRTYSPTFSPTVFASNFSKLCLATFDATGKCVDAQGSLRRVLQEA